MTLLSASVPTELGTDEPAARPERMRDLFRGPGWPLAWLLVLYPVWWVLGLTPFIWIAFALPMVWYLVRLDRIAFPPMFWLWALFLLVVVVSGLMLNVDAPGTLPLGGQATGRYISYLLRLANYLAVTVIMLFVGNVPERLLPRMRIIRMLGVLFLTAVVGGLVGSLVPGLSFRSPVEILLPSALTNNDFVQRLVHVDVSQQQDVLEAPRPSAPFEYANSWGNNFSILLVWFVVGWLIMGNHRRRIAATLVLTVSLLPVIYSQNRGMWIGLGLSAAYVAVRLAIRRHYAAVGGLVLAVLMVGGLLLGTPLSTVITNRLDTPRSNEIRASLAQQSVAAALTSPIVGYGNTRQTLGSERSVAIGKSADCPRCGNRVIGSTGQITLLLISQGFLGAALYVLFLAQAAIRYLFDHSTVGIAGGVALMLALWYMFFYGALVSPLAMYLISLALLWRNAQARTGEAR